MVRTEIAYDTLENICASIMYLGKICIFFFAIVHCPYYTSPWGHYFCLLAQ